jgi:hypothetical protein
VPQDWFSLNAPKAPAAPQGDWFAQNAPKPINVGPAAVAQPEPEKPGGFSIGDTLSGLWDSVNPMPAIKQFVASGQAEWDRATEAASRGDYTGAVLHAINANPVTQVGHVGVQLGKAQWDQAVKAKQMFTEGRVSEGTGYALAAILPVLGPAAAKTGETAATGEVDRALGEGIGLVGGVLVPGGLARARGVTVKPPIANPNPAVADAVAFGRAHGVPIDAATATGNQFVRGAQALSEHSIPGSVITSKAKAAQAKGLATVGEQLAAKAHPTPITPEQAGQGIRDAVTEQLRAHAGDANTAYETLRKIEADPSNTRSITPTLPEGSSAAARGKILPAAGGRFAKAGASIEDLFQGALGDARRNGFAGSADDLRQAFYEEIRVARSLGEEMAAVNKDYAPAALLRDIRAYGGIKPFVKDIQAGGPTRKLRGEFASIVESFGSKNGWNQRGGGTVFRNEGLGIDEMIDRLRQDPKWQPLIENERDLFTALDDIARQGPAAVGESADLEHLLRASGIEPGSQWWSKVPSGAVDMQLPVDLRSVKANLKPIYNEMMSRYPVAQQEASKGLKALENIVNGPDYSPLSTVDANLGAIKSIARSDLPELRSVSQGTAAGAVKQLDAIVRQTAEQAGPEALWALETGRKATIQKYGAADVLEQLRGEPVQTFNQATYAKDAGIAKLREIAKLAPAELPKIGRAFLDDLMGQATAEGSFKNAAAIATKWEKLGAETKRLLYKDPGHIKDLDRFFLLAKKMAENPNPSGSALVGSVGGGIAHIALHPATGIPLQLGQGALAAFLHSPRGVKLLTQGFTIPIGNKAAATAYATQLARFASEQRIPVGLPTAADSQAGPGEPIAQR